jgi:hypothetical protein
MGETRSSLSSFRSTGLVADARAGFLNFTLVPLIVRSEASPSRLSDVHDTRPERSSPCVAHLAVSNPRGLCYQQTIYSHAFVPMDGFFDLRDFCTLG